MFEFLFKYPPAIFAKGNFVLLSPWPLWLLLLLIAGGRRRALLVYAAAARVAVEARSIAIWLAQTALFALLLLMLWHPAISVARLRPQENVVAVLVDHSRSMGIADDGKPRLAQRRRPAERPAASRLSKRFQVRLYEFGRDAVRVDQARESDSRRQRHAHRRQPEAYRGRSRHHAAGRDRADDRTAAITRAASTARPSRSCASCRFRCTPSASGRIISRRILRLSTSRRRRARCRNRAERPGRHPAAWLMPGRK